jgi:hypothetical protein
MGTRNSVFAGIAFLALFGCATPESLRQQAIANCQAVGISESDPEFANCTYAYTRAHLENRLETSYRDALDASPPNRQRRHDGIF